MAGCRKTRQTKTGGERCGWSAETIDLFEDLSDRDLYIAQIAYRRSYRSGEL